MLSKFFEKLISEGDTTCFQLESGTGFRLSIFGQKSLETAIETLTKYGLMAPQASPAQLEEEEVPVIEGTCTLVGASLRPVPLALPNEGFSLVESIQMALKNSLEENRALMEKRIEELLNGQDDCPTFAEVQSQYFEYLGPDKGHASLGLYRFFFASFENLLGNKKLNEIKSTDVNRYLAALSCYPPNASKKSEYKGKTFSEIVSQAIATRTKGLQKSSQKTHVNYVRAFFNWCYDQLDLKRNPCSGIRTRRYKKTKEQARSPFDTVDLTKIFDRLRLRTYRKPHMYWVPLIALYSGMRVNEIAQLHTCDVQEVEIDLDSKGKPIKVWCFDVTPTDGKTVKTEHSVRFVPVHSKLIELGLLDYLKDLQGRGMKRLFPGIKKHVNGPGARISSWFNNSLLRTKCQILDRRKTFHSFRNTFWTLGDRSRVLETALIKIAGYNPGDDIQRIHYIKRADVRECKVALESIHYPSLDLMPYEPAYFKDYLDDAQAKATPEDLVPIIVTKKRGRPSKPKTPPATSSKSKKAVAMAPFDED